MKKYGLKITLLFFLVPFLCFSESPRDDFIEESVDTNLERLKKLKVKTISDLKGLTPFESVSIIQKRYLQKTFRGEISASFSSTINNSFFYFIGGSGHLGFFVREDHGFGLEGYGMYHNTKIIAGDLIGEPNRILPYSFVVSQTYGGVYYKWSPVFGKFAVLNNNIVYFDMFFTLGGGVTKVTSGITPALQSELKDESPLPAPVKNWVPTGSLGLGQVFALNKNVGLIWNLKWFFYTYQLSGIEGLKWHSDLNFSIGVSYYFPGATYR